MARKALTLDQMRALVTPLANQYGLSVPLVLAIAAHESGGFKPWATRGEPQIGDASVGLMQVLYSTAKTNGYSGPVGKWDDATNTGTGLYDPATNLRYGIKFLAGLLKSTNGDVSRAVAAYNAGLGNAKRVTVPTRFCLAWKPTAPKSGRNLDKDCARIYTAQPGEFLNQPYVNTIMSLARGYGFDGSVSGGGVANPGTLPKGVGTPPAPTGKTLFVVNAGLFIAAAAVIGVVWMMKQGGAR